MNTTTYNGIPIPKTIKPTRIISAFQNEMDWEKVNEYTDIMIAEMLSHSFPNIQGFPHIIQEEDVGGMFLTGKNVEDKHIGQMVWMVTNGHHRSFAAIAANLPYIGVELDSTITSEEDLK